MGKFTASIFKEYDGESKTINEIAKELGVNRNTIYKRIQRKGLDAALLPKKKKRGSLDELRKPTEAEIEGARLLRSLRSNLQSLQHFFDNTYFAIQDNGISDRTSERIHRLLLLNKSKLVGAAEVAEKIYVPEEIKKPVKRSAIEWIDIHVAVCNAYTKANDLEKKISEDDMNVIIGGIANYFDTTIEMLKSNSRKAKYVMARMFFAYICYPKVTFAKIGKFLGGRNHATIMKYVSNMKYDLAHNAEVTKRYSEVKNLIEL